MCGSHYFPTSAGTDQLIPATEARGTQTDRLNMHRPHLSAGDAGKPRHV